MIETAEFAEGIKPFGPRLLSLAFQCEKFRTLPYTGGVMEQPAGLLDKMDTVQAVYNSYLIYNRDGKKAGEMAKWKNENNEIWKIVAKIERMRNGSRRKA